MRKLLRIAYLLALIATTLCSAEVTSRIDDWWRDDVPLLSSPASDHSLKISDENGTRGRPLGRYKKWKLNEWGFRGNSVLLQRPPSRRRVLILGASEAFGLYESPGMEFPAQLQYFLGDENKYEVINASVTGMTLGSMHWHWRYLCAQFTPDVVVIYASPLFYLGEGAPTIREAPFPVPERAPLTPKSRFLERLRDVLDVPQFVQDWRNKRWIASRVAGKPFDWQFRKPPLDRLDAFAEHLRKLGRLVQQQGAQVILCTHATRTAAPFSAQDLAEYERGRVILPRATARAAAEFHLLANGVIRDVAGEEGWQLADVDEALSGHPALFGDLVHFTDEGAKRMAQLLAQLIVTTTAKTQE